MTELTEAMKSHIQNTWDIVRKNMTKHASSFFVCFFTRYPEHQKVFHDFPDVPISDLPNEQKFRGHAVRVFFAITSLVDNLDDLDTVVDIMQKTVTDHKPRGIHAKHFEDLFETILYFLDTTLGDSFGAGERGSWETVANILLSVVHEGDGTQLTETKRDLVADSWETIRKDTRKHALDLLTLFLKRHPEHVELFQDDVPLGQRFKGQAVRTFYIISSLVDNLDDIEILSHILRKTARDRYDIGVRTHHYKDLFATLIAFLAQTLGDEFDDSTRQAWEATSINLLKVIGEEVDRMTPNSPSDIVSYP